MQINKIEALILAESLKEQKYEIAEIAGHSKQEANELMSDLELLESRLKEFSTDKRQFGRTSDRSFSSRIRKYFFGKAY